MKKLILLVSVIVSLNLAVKSETTPVKKEIVCTTVDLKENYEVLKIVTGFAPLTFPASDENFAKAYTEAWSKLSYEASKVHATSVIGIRIEQIKSADGQSDKLVVYGTAVKVK